MHICTRNNSEKKRDKRWKQVTCNTKQNSWQRKIDRIRSQKKSENPVMYEFMCTFCVPDTKGPISY